MKESLESLNPHKSPGPDGLHPRVLNELSNEISKPLPIIMQKSLDEHTLPQSWKYAHVSPMFKKGYGIRGDILEWIRLFIKGRRQRVVVNGKK